MSDSRPPDSVERHMPGYLLSGTTRPKRCPRKNSTQSAPARRQVRVISDPQGYRRAARAPACCACDRWCCCRWGSRSRPSPCWSSQVVQTVALAARAEGALTVWVVRQLAVGHFEEGGKRPGVGRRRKRERGAYFGCFSRPRVHGIDFTREMPVFLPFTGFPVNGSFFGKSVVITRL